MGNTEKWVKIVFEKFVFVLLLSPYQCPAGFDELIRVVLGVWIIQLPLLNDHTKYHITFIRLPEMGGFLSLQTQLWASGDEHGQPIGHW